MHDLHHHLRNPTLLLNKYHVKTHFQNDFHSFLSSNYLSNKVSYNSRLLSLTILFKLRRNDQIIGYIHNTKQSCSGDWRCTTHINIIVIISNQNIEQRNIVFTKTDISMIFFYVFMPICSNPQNIEPRRHRNLLRAHSC